MKSSSEIWITGGRRSGRGGAAGVLPVGAAPRFTLRDSGPGLGEK